MASIWRDRLRALGGKKTLAQLGARAPMIVSSVLGLAIVMQAAVIGLSLWGEAAAGLGTDSTRTIRTGTQAERGTGLQNITAAQLFGASPLTMTASDTRAASRTPLVLTGTIATRDPRVGYAILGSSATNTRTVYTGTEAAPGTVLAEVYPQWVVLMRGNERVMLYLPHKGTPSAGLAYAPALARGSPPPDTDDDDESGSATPTYLPPAPITDGAAVLHAFALRRTMVDGQQGERIGNSSLSQKALATLNLAPGDVIVQINGVPVGASNTPDLMSVLQSGSTTLMVVKDGQEMSVTIDSGSMADAAAIVRQTQPDL